MKNDIPRSQCVWRALACAGLSAAVFLAPAGCNRPAASTLELISYKDPYFPQPYQAKLADCAYRVAAGGDLYIAGRGEQVLSGSAVTQYLQLHLFWTPYPGKTPSNATTTDATIRYVIASQSGVAVYAGTGFVSTKRRSLDQALEVRIENARLRLESQTGEPPELLGEARLSGQLTAANDPNRAVDYVRQLELRAAGGPPAE